MRAEDPIIDVRFSSLTVVTTRHPNPTFYHFHHQEFKMPRGKSAKKSAENVTPRIKLSQEVKEMILEDHSSGMDAEEIAEKHGISIVEYVRRVIRKDSQGTPGSETRSSLHFATPHPAKTS